MSYLVLARKYRPQTFADVVGQDVIVKTLRKALECGRIAHAFLFTGSRGIGKTTIARILAKSLACEKRISDTPCGRCVHCQEIVQGTSIDVVEIDGASNTSVDDVRALRENIRYQPSSCRFKIFIIDEVHMLSNSAFNALLKTLEEPPPHVKFIFATTESHKIPITILSRCQRYDFKRLSVETIVERLLQILKAENFSVDPEGLFLIAKSAEGGMRDALSLMDQVLSFASGPVSLEDVTQSLGLLDRQNIVTATDALIQADAKAALAVVDKAIQNGFDLNQLMSAVSTEFRHLTIAASAGSIAGFADLSKDEVELIDQKAKTLDSADVQRLFAMALDGIDLIAKSQKPQLMLELVFLRMADRPPMAEASTIAHAIAKLETLSKNVQSVPISFDALSPKEETPKKVAVIETKADLEKSINLSWARFVEGVIKNTAILGHHLEQARFIDVVKEANRSLVKIEFENQLHYEQVLLGQKNEKLIALLSQFYGPGAELNPSFLNTSKSDLSGAMEIKTPTIHEAKQIAEQLAQKELDQSAQSDPIVQKALALFGGEIRFVKRN